MLPAWLVLVLLAGTVYRLTRLITTDDFPPIRWARGAITDFAFNSHPRWEFLGDLVSCQWCASGWVALGAVVATDQVIPGGLGLPVLWWLAAWGLGAVAMNYEDRSKPVPATQEPQPTRVATPSRDDLVPGLGRTSAAFDLKPLAERYLGSPAQRALKPDLLAEHFGSRITSQGEFATGGYVTDLRSIASADLVRYAVSRVGTADVIRYATRDLTGSAREQALRDALTSENPWYDVPQGAATQASPAQPNQPDGDAR